ncbi:MAG TPA: hypothetical protein VIH99_04690 [Bdellovibrionota bacterium]|jgi:hypothetical protein
MSSKVVGLGILFFAFSPLSHAGDASVASGPPPFVQARQAFTSSMWAFGKAKNDAKKSSDALLAAASCSANRDREKDTKALKDGAIAIEGPSSEILAGAKKLAIPPSAPAPAGGPADAGQAALITELNDKFFNDYLAEAQAFQQKTFPADSAAKTKFEAAIESAQTHLNENYQKANQSGSSGIPFVSKVAGAKLSCGVPDLNALYKNAFRDLKAYKASFRSADAAATTMESKLAALIAATKSAQAELASRAKGLGSNK